jgi:hypothetical protein
LAWAACRPKEANTSYALELPLGNSQDARLLRTITITITAAGPGISFSNMLSTLGRVGPGSPIVNRIILYFTPPIRRSIFVAFFHPALQAIRTPVHPLNLPLAKVDVPNVLPMHLREVPTLSVSL